MSAVGRAVRSAVPERTGRSRLGGLHGAGGAPRADGRWRLLVSPRESFTRQTESAKQLRPELRICGETARELFLW